METPYDIARRYGIAATTKKDEYERSIEMIGQIQKDKGTLLMLCFLIDSQYDTEDLKKMVNLICEQKGYNPQYKIKD